MSKQRRQKISPALDSAIAKMADSGLGNLTRREVNAMVSRGVAARARYVPNAGRPSKDYRKPAKPDEHNLVVIGPGDIVTVESLDG